MLNQARAPDADARAAWLGRLAALLEAGLPMQQALPLLTMTRPEAERAHWLLLEQGVQQGLSLSRSMVAMPGFSPGDRALIACGEDSGQLAAQLQRLAASHQRALGVRRQLRRALRYPLVVLSGTLLVTLFLLMEVVPTFASLYSQFGARLPALTEAVLTLSVWVTTWGLPATAMLGIGIVLLGRAWSRQPGLRRWLLAQLWTLPLTRRVTRSHWLALWHRLLADQMEAGLPLPTALDRCAALVAESPLRSAQAGLKTGVEAGQPLSMLLAAAPGYPPDCSALVALGEESGLLVLLLRTLSDDFEHRFDEACQQLTSLVEPMLMALLGLVVGTLVMALYLPLFQLGQVM